MPKLSYEDYTNIVRDVLFYLKNTNGFTIKGAVLNEKLAQGKFLVLLCDQFQSPEGTFKATIKHYKSGVTVFLMDRAFLGAKEEKPNDLYVSSVVLELIKRYADKDSHGKISEEQHKIMSALAVDITEYISSEFGVEKWEKPKDPI